MFTIYRNLHRGEAFSIQDRGIVVDRLTDIIALSICFKVSEPGRQRVLLQKQKNVHAFVVCESYTACTEQDISALTLITYNPYLNSSFMMNGEPIYNAEAVLFTGGKCYLIK